MLTDEYMVVKDFRYLEGDLGSCYDYRVCCIPLYATGKYVVRLHFVLGPYMDLIHSSEQKKCPRCSSHLVHRSRRRGLVEKMAHALLQISPYRCDECDHRYFRWRYSHHTHVHRAA